MIEGNKRKNKKGREFDYSLPKYQNGGYTNTGMESPREVVISDIIKKQNSVELNDYYKDLGKNGNIITYDYIKSKDPFYEEFKKISRKEGQNNYKESFEVSPQMAEQFFNAANKTNNLYSDINHRGRTPVKYIVNTHKESLQWIPVYKEPLKVKETEKKVTPKSSLIENDLNNDIEIKKRIPTPVEKDTFKVSKKWSNTGYTSNISGKKVEVGNSITGLNDLTSYDVTDKYGDKIKVTPKEYRELFNKPKKYQDGGSFPEELLLRQAYKESTFNPRAKSPAGYKGLTQIGDAVIKDYQKDTGKTNIDPFNPEHAVAVQRWSMNDLYNASFINKPNQLEQVRQAKALAAYNWGRGNVSSFLNKKKEEGYDIYKSLDWLNDLPQETSDYINKILLKNNNKFEKNYNRAVGKTKYKNYYNLKQEEPVHSSSGGRGMDQMTQYKNGGHLRVNKKGRVYDYSINKK